MKGHKRIWTEDQLRQAVQDSKTMTEVYHRLGYPHGSNTLEPIVSRLGLDISHFHRRYTDDQLRQAVKTSKTFHEVCLKLGYKSCWSRSIARDIGLLCLNTKHFNSRVKLQDLKKFRRVIRTSKSTAEVARRLGVSRPAVVRLAAKLGLELPKMSKGW